MGDADPLRDPICVPQETPVGFPDRRHAAATIALLAASAVVLYLVDPATTRCFPPCPFHTLTGLYCPGCGSLRASHQLLHGRVGAAFGLNPLMVLAAPPLAYALLCRLADTVTSIRLPRPRMRAWWAWAVLVVILAFWILRNVPVAPFRALAP
jgi:hypothetical protein